MKIAIEGNIGCGKTTVIKSLNDSIRIPIFLEPLHKWNEMLTLFYKDPAKWAFPFNLEVISSFHEWKNNTFPAIYERSPLSCRHVFTQLNHDTGHIHELELSVFDKIYKELAWKPEAIIYIRTDPNICSNRMAERARECEKELPIEYIQMVHDKYEDMIRNKTDGIIVFIVDGNNSREEVFKQVESIVMSILSYSP